MGAIQIESDSEDAILAPMTLNTVCLSTVRKADSDLAIRQIAHHMFTTLGAHGIDLSCKKAQASYRVILAIIQGMFDKQAGSVTDRSVLIEALCFAFDPQDFNISNDTEEFFGHLLSYVDKHQ